MAAYDINNDLDVNQFDADDYLDLTQATMGEGMRSTAVNIEFIIAAFIFFMFLTAITILVGWQVKKRSN